MASKIRWVGPFQLRRLLDRCMDVKQPWPPEANGVYVVSDAVGKRCPGKRPAFFTLGATRVNHRFS